MNPLKWNRGKRKTNAITRLLRWQSELTGWRIAQAIREAASGPEAYCTDATCKGRITHLALVAAAAFAEEHAAGRAPDISRPDPCSSAVLAAEAKLAGPR